MPHENEIPVFVIDDELNIRQSVVDSLKHSDRFFCIGSAESISDLNDKLQQLPLTLSYILFLVDNYSKIYDRPTGSVSEEIIRQYYQNKGDIKTLIVAYTTGRAAYGDCQIPKTSGQGLIDSLNELIDHQVK